MPFRSSKSRRYYLDTVKAFDFDGRKYEIRQWRENDHTFYAVFQEGKRANAYIYSSYDLDLIPTDAELISIAEADIRDGIWEKGLCALRQGVDKL